jgi:membrane-bound ClpP family serine protease
MACDQIVMHPNAVLGGEGERRITRGQIETATTVLQDVARRKSRSWSLFVAWIDPDLVAHRYTKLGRRATLTEYLTQAEFDETYGNAPDAEKWKRQEVVTPEGNVLQLSAEQAETLGLAAVVVDNFTEFKGFFNLEEDPIDVRPGWAHQLVEAIGHHELRWLLLMIAIAAMYAEMQTPGLGIGGFISGVAFLLYFWSQFLNGTVEWLEVLLFVAGIACLLVELFVFPGFGIFGLGGGALVVGSLVLASQTFVIPTNSYQMTQFRHSVVTIGLALFGFIALAVLIRRYLPSAPVFGKVVLEPPSPEVQQQREALVDLEYLVAAHGVTTTPLRPSGMARFNDRLVHVISTGDLIESGADVVVERVTGSRVVVRRIA